MRVVLMHSVIAGRFNSFGGRYDRATGEEE
jgi:hypothetical protein